MNWESLGVFLFGFLSCALLVFSFGSNLEVPFGTGLSVFGQEVNAPSDHVGDDDILVLDDRVILKISGVSLSSYADSGSMVPVLDKGANGIRVVPVLESEIEVGDIVSFKMAGMLVVHRVIEKGVDEDGIYFLVKGDANLIGDGRIRFSDIEYITIGVIY